MRTRVEQIGVDYYRLIEPYQTREQLSAAIPNHERKALEYCPEGYSKRGDYDRVDGSERILVWEIGCNKQYRPSNSDTRKNSIR